MLVLMTIRTELKVPLEKAAPFALPMFRHPWSGQIGSIVILGKPMCFYYRDQSLRNQQY